MPSSSPGEQPAAHDFFPAGFVTLQSPETAQHIHLLWCIDSRGYEAIAVLPAAACIPVERLIPSFIPSVRAAAVEKLFPCEGVLNDGSIQCTGPFRLEVEGHDCTLYAANWMPEENHCRAFLIFEAESREEAIRPIQALRSHHDSGNEGLVVLASDRIRLLCELKDIAGNMLRPKQDFVFTHTEAG